jgi:hypothetical protein
MKKYMVRSSGLYIIILISSLWVPGRVYSQTSGQAGISGQLLDTAARQLLEGASVRLLQVRDGDTAVIAGTLAKENGGFSMAHLPLGSYILSVTFQGYENWKEWVSFTTPRPVISRKLIYLRPSASELGRIEVKDTRPIRMHGDTTAYQADQFHTRPNGTAGDLIQKMPGIDVTRSGTVVAQGDTVKRILVNGKRFFSNNLGVALKVLPRDIISQIEVFDDKSDQAKFTGVDDGIRIRTINIVLKKSIRSGTFGKVSAGMGSAADGSGDLLYSDNVSLNRIHGESMATLIGSGDNTAPVMGGATRNLSGGLNFTDHWGKHTQASGSYSEGNTLTRTSVRSYTENLIPGDSSIYNTQAQNNRSSYNQQMLDMNLETELDSADHLTLRGNGGYSTSSTNAQSATSSTKGMKTPLNNSDNASATGTSTTNGSLSALWGHRFRKKGRTLSLDADINTTHGSGTGTNQYQNTYFTPGQPDSVSAVNQFYSSPNNSTAWNVTLSYTEPLGRRSSLSLDYNYTGNQAETGRATYGWDSTIHRYDLPDSSLTNLFRNVYQSERGGIRYHYGDKRLQVTAGMGVQTGLNDSRNESNGTDLSQHYSNLYPLATLDYSPAKGEDMRLDYQGQTMQPPLSALEPVVNNTDPLNVVIGNPHLAQAFTHSVGLTYNRFNPSTYQHVFASVHASVMEHMVVNRTSVDALTGVDTTTYTNLNGNYSLNGYVDYGFRLAHPASNLSFGATLSDTHSVGFVNNVLNGTSNYTLGGTLKWTTNLPDHLDLNLTESPLYTIAVYSAEPSQNTRYLTEDLDLDGLYYSKSGWELGTDIHYTTYSGRPAGFNPTTAVWNLSLAHLFFKHQQGEVKFTVHDVLDQASGVSQSFTPTMIQNTQGVMLGRYYLVSFAYHFKR